MGAKTTRETTFHRRGSSPRLRVAGLIFVALVARTPGAEAQIPDKFENLQVLPKDISKQDLVATMRGFSMGLGVRCAYCHLDEEGKPHGPHDFAVDDKAPKKTARLMMQMVGDINQKWIPQVQSDRKERVAVACATCHHGQAVPRTLQATLASALADSGLPAAQQKYRKLRDKYYGRDSFDFGEQSLNEMARGLLVEKRTADAVGMLQLNAEFNPQSAQVQVMLGDAFAQSGDKDQAAASYRKALELNPQSEAAKKRLAELDAK